MNDHIRDFFNDFGPDRLQEENLIYHYHLARRIDMYNIKKVVLKGCPTIKGKVFLKEDGEFTEPIIANHLKKEIKKHDFYFALF